MIEIIFILLVLSVTANVLTIWYAISLLKKYLPISEDLEDLFERLDEYHFHTKTVSEMESFYGDEILLNLLRHSKSIVQEVDEFRAAYSLLDQDDELLELEEGEIIDDNQDQNDPSEEEASFQRKAIFHEGA